MLKALTDRIAVVTGAGSGIGAGIAHKLAEMGATVILVGRTRTKLEAVAKSIAAAGNKAEAMECDVADLGSVEQLAQSVEKKFGRADILVNNAGVGAFGGPLHTMPPKEWDAIINTNLRGVFYCIRSFAPKMIEAGRGEIVNISSIAGKNALANGAAYAASKWGLNGLSYSVAEELRTHNIRVSVVCPGSTNSDFGLPKGKNTNKMLQPEDIAHVVAMLVTQAPQSFVSEVIIRPTQKP
ncbi:MAG TPA: SDR family NAD(P)-dependent oxidoreductase [Terriglobales bacterium]|jgi:NAD(P)-dependent dehydrogenase (short-subunit alcohol dehydrogenase family)